MSPLQSLVAIISLAILKLPLSLDYIEAADDRASRRKAKEIPYIADPSIFQELHEIIVTAANASLFTASPAVLGWSIMLQAMRSHTQTRLEAQELRQSRQLLEGFEGSDSSETEGGESSATETGATPEPPPQAAYPGQSHAISIYDDFIESLMDHEPDEDPIEHLAKSVLVGGQVFEIIASIATGICSRSGPLFDGGGDKELRMRLVLLELIRPSLSLVEYASEVIATSLAVITGGERYWEFADRTLGLRSRCPSSRAAVDDIASIFMLDDVHLIPQLLNRAYERFPYEPLPFLQLARALATGPTLDDTAPPPVMSMLENMTSYTQVLPPGFDAYETIREEENSNQIFLTAHLELFRQHQAQALLTPAGRGDSRALVVDRGGGNGVFIPSGTRGRVVSQDQPFAVQWDHCHSGFCYLGNLLQCYLPGNTIVESATDSPPDREVVIEIIGLLTNLITAGTTEQAKHLLAEASGGLDRNRDVVALVFDNFESELQQDQLQATGGDTIELLITCIQFIYALMAVLPAKVWPFLARSSLLEIDGNGGKLASIVAGVELITGDFAFLIGCVRVFEALVDDAINNAVSRKIGGRRRAGRFAEPEEHATVVPDKVIKKVLLAYGQTMVDVLESAPNWRFANPGERQDVPSRIMSAFNSILRHTYGVDDSSDLNSKVTGVLAPISTYLTDVFLNTSSNPAIGPIIRVFPEGVDIRETTLFLGTLASTTKLVRDALALSTTLVQVRHLLALSPSYLEDQLLRATPLIARSYATHDSCRGPVVQLLEAMASAVAASDEQPPPLLGHLGSQSARDFLSVLSQLDRPYDDEGLERLMWRLFSAIVSGRQQWLSIYLLTGNTPRDSLKGRTDGGAKSKTLSRPLFAVALEAASNIRLMSRGKALAVLEFIAVVSDHWPWATSAISKDPTFLKLMAEYVEGLSQDEEIKNMSNSERTASTLRLASLVAEILAMYIHQARQTGDTSFAKKTVSQLTFFLDKAVKVPGYNVSLHANLRRNFEERFPACRLSGFKKTKLRRRDFGGDYFYDTSLARRMLSFDRGWAGVKEAGLAGELERANINLSVVEAQVVSQRLSSALPNHQAHNHLVAAPQLADPHD